MIGHPLEQMHRISPQRMWFLTRKQTPQIGAHLVPPLLMRVRTVHRMQMRRVPQSLLLLSLGCMQQIPQKTIGRPLGQLKHLLRSQSQQKVTRIGAHLTLRMLAAARTRLPEIRIQPIHRSLLLMNLRRMHLMPQRTIGRTSGRHHPHYPRLPLFWLLLYPLQRPRRACLMRAQAIPSGAHSMPWCLVVARTRLP